MPRRARSIQGGYVYHLLNRSSARQADPPYAHGAGPVRRLPSFKKPPVPFSARGDAGRHGVQIDVSTSRQQRLLIEDRHALEPALEERAAGLLLTVGQP